jgi:hypothetical protein
VNSPAVDFLCLRKTYSHDQPRDEKRSSIILQGVARQILQKAGVRLWWVSLPKEIPLPAVFVGVDVFHAPRVYDQIQKQRVAKASCAAIVVQVIRSDNQQKNKVEIYSETFARSAGQEYGLQDALSKAVSNALTMLKVNPMSCVVWRDGESWLGPCQPCLDWLWVILDNVSLIPFVVVRRNR